MKTQKNKQNGGQEKQNTKERRQTNKTVTTKKTKQQKQQNSNKKQTNTKQNKTKGKRENEKKRLPSSNSSHFSEIFFTCSLPVSSLKSLEHNPFTLLKSCYLLDAIFSKSNCFL